ncbi:MAG TPA: hypothetical protein VFV34_15080 [Blastocatellia bacterium]|nr:hypothetical protein [Blastocatellia bacterium]
MQTSVWTAAIVSLLISGLVFLMSKPARSQTESRTARVELPAPTGNYAVGRTTFYWIDSSRPEAITEDPNDKRELVVTLWYPAASATGAVAPYFENLDKLAGAVDPIQATFIRSVRAHTLAQATLSSAEPSYPVLLFSPGNEMNSVLYTAQIEDLVSCGYVVLGIDHPYESLGVLYPDGRIARHTDLNPKPGSPDFAQRAARSYRERVDRRAEDAVFALGKLAELNEGRPPTQFKGRLDLTHLGGFGHSIGGVAAAQFCQIDKRFKACLNLDGHADSLPLFPDSAGKGPEQPFMVIEDVAPEPTEKQLSDWKLTREQVKQMRERIRTRSADLLKTVKSGSWRVTLSGATHQSFSDELLVLNFGDATARAENRRRTEIIRAYTVAFFDHCLKGRNSKLILSPTNDYPEAAVERFLATRP